MSIEVKNVTKYYGSQKALDDLSFSIPKGQIVGFLGPNGAGKSSMMRILTTYLEADQGEVLVDGVNVREDPNKVRLLTGYLPEHNPLYTEMYVKESLLFFAGLYEIPQAKSRIAEVIALSGLTDHAHKRIKELSKGYRQRVGLAQAILHAPEVLILDEPTTGLDPNQLVVIRDLIKKVGEHSTVLLSTHIMQEVEAMCERVIIIDKGRIVADRLLDEQAQAQRVVVELVRPLTESSFSIPSLIEVQEVHETKWRFVFDTIEDQRAVLSAAIQEQGGQVIGMYLEEDRLEDVFQQLTKKA